MIELGTLVCSREGRNENYM